MRTGDDQLVRIQRRWSHEAKSQDASWFSAGCLKKRKVPTERIEESVRFLLRCLAKCTTLDGHEFTQRRETWTKHWKPTMPYSKRRNDIYDKENTLQFAYKSWKISMIWCYKSTSTEEATNVHFSTSTLSALIQDHSDWLHDWFLSPFSSFLSVSVLAFEIVHLV